MSFDLIYPFIIKRRPQMPSPNIYATQIQNSERNRIVASKLAARQNNKTLINTPNNPNRKQNYKNALKRMYEQEYNNNQLKTNSGYGSYLRESPYGETGNPDYPSQRLPNPTGYENNPIIHSDPRNALYVTLRQQSPRSNTLYGQLPTPNIYASVNKSQTQTPGPPLPPRLYKIPERPNNVMTNPFSRQTYLQALNEAIQESNNNTKKILENQKKQFESDLRKLKPIEKTLYALPLVPGHKGGSKKRTHKNNNKKSKSKSKSRKYRK
jgi:hypothetical protein